MVSWNGQYFDVNNEKHSVQINVLQELIEVDPVDGMRYAIPGLRYTEFFLDGEMVFEQDFARVYPLLHGLATPRESRKATPTMNNLEIAELTELCRSHGFPEENIAVLIKDSWTNGEMFAAWKLDISECRSSRRIDWRAFFDVRGLPSDWLSIPLVAVASNAVITTAVCRWCRGTGIVQGLQETYPCLECQTK